MTIDLASPRPRLGCIQTLRGIAASIVVFYHVARHIARAAPAPHLADATQFGHAGVDLFFVLSGFIILFVHHGDVGTPTRWMHYAMRRFRRVFPTYWVALIVTVLLGLAGSHAAPSMLAILRSASLLPAWQAPLLGVAWTLQFEIAFYAMFGVLIVNRAAGLAVLLSWLAAILLTWAGMVRIAAWVPAMVCDPFNLEFFLGMGTAWWLRRAKVPMPGAVFSLGLSGFAIAAFLEDAGLIDGYAPAARLAYGVPSALLVLGVVELERSFRVSAPRWSTILGSASYSIYLFQFIVIGAVWQLLHEVGLAGALPALVLFVLLAAAAIAGGLVVSHTIEQPLVRWTWRRGVRPI